MLDQCGYGGVDLLDLQRVIACGGQDGRLINRYCESVIVRRDGMIFGKSRIGGPLLLGSGRRLQ